MHLGKRAQLANISYVMMTIFQIYRPCGGNGVGGGLRGKGGEKWEKLHWHYVYYPFDKYLLFLLNNFL